jgi:hypothetical protein
MRTALLCLAAALAVTSARTGETRAAGDEDDKAPEKSGGEGETFESLAKGAQPAPDVGALLGALVDRCAGEKRTLDHARCQATLAYLRRTLPEHAFSIDAPDPAAISVSPYDETLKGYRISLTGCIACTSPVQIGRSSDPVFVTLKKPAEAKPGGGKSAAAADGAESLAGAVEIASLPLGFPSQGEARRWLGEVRPHLRAEMVFNASASEWRFRSTRGYALGLVAARIVDTCTGAIILSSPPSTGLGERAAASPDDDVCKSAARVAAKTETGKPGAPAPTEEANDDDDEDKPLPTELSRAVIAESMGRIRAQVFACFERFRVPGAAPLTYEVAGNGSVQSVKLGGALSGTPTGDCIVEAAHGARFPRFDGPIQTFTYPFFLRR